MDDPRGGFKRNINNRHHQRTQPNHNILMVKVNKERNGCVAHSLFGAIGSQDVEVSIRNLNLFYNLILYIVPFKLDMEDPFQLNLLFFLSMYRPPMEGKLNDTTFAFARQQYLNLHCTVHF